MSTHHAPPTTRPISWPHRIAEIVAREGAAARVVIVSTHGPTPRAVGAAMLVSPARHEGKIGRPDVEALAVEAAQGLIHALPAPEAKRPAWLRELLRFRSGEVLGEATGGSIEVLVEAYGPSEAAALVGLVAAGSGAQTTVLVRPVVSGPAPELLSPGDGGEWAFRDGARVRLVASDGVLSLVLERIAASRATFHVYGTGLVARALVRLLADLPFDVAWLDSAPGHFPAIVPPGVVTEASPDLAMAAGSAPRGGFHAVMTADHDLDLAICRAVLQSGDFAFLGVIGSQLKRERMSARLRADGLAEEAIARLACPIGLAQIRSKAPAVIAVGIAAQALAVLTTGQPAGSKA